MNAEVPFPFGIDGYACALALFAAGVTAIIATTPVRSLAWFCGAVDNPGGRRVHARPTARLGGIAVLLALLLGCATPLIMQVVAAGDFEGRLASWPWILGTAVAVCALGAWDDIRGLSPSAKLLGLALAALTVSTLGGVRIDVLELPGLGRFELEWMAVPATVIWIVACTNAVNLIDGVDGGGASVGMVSAGVLALVALGTGDVTSAILFCALAGATAGFLFHNRHPATIFLGDSGSLLIGFVIAATSAGGCTKRTTALSLIAALLALAVPLLDSTQSFCRRFRKAFTQQGRRRVLAALRATAIADQDHIHHRLLSRGLDHAQVARVLGLVTAATGLIALLLLPNGQTTTLTVLGAGLAASIVLVRLGAVQRAERTASGEAATADRSAPEPIVVLTAKSPAAPAEVLAPSADANRPQVLVPSARAPKATPRTPTRAGV